MKEVVKEEVSERLMQNILLVDVVCQILAELECECRCFVLESTVGNIRVHNLAMDVQTRAYLFTNAAGRPINANCITPTRIYRNFFCTIYCAFVPVTSAT